MISKTSNKCVRPQTLCFNDLVPKTAGYVQKDLSASDFAPKSERLKLFMNPSIVVIILFLDPDSKYYFGTNQCKMVKVILSLIFFRWNSYVVDVV